LYFISHTHPDHFDSQFLTAYLKQYPQAKVLIADQTPDLLGRKLRSRGIEPVVRSVSVGETGLFTVPNKADRGLNIDSALVVQHGTHSVVNLNDNPYDQGQIDTIRQLCPDGVTVALLPFVGAGPWPQCYEHSDVTVLLAAGEAKKQKGLAAFTRYCEALQPTVAVPFAGQYWLHGEQLDLNPLRGMADATECDVLWKSVWVPADGGKATLTIHDDGIITAEGTRIKPYDWPTVRKALDRTGEPMTAAAMNAQYEDHRYRYEREIQVPVERLPLLKLLESAARNAAPQFKDKPTLHIYIKTQLPQWFHLITTSSYAGECEQPWEVPRTEVYIDARSLFSVLTRLANGNSARIGSLVRFRDVPAEYDEARYDLFGQYWDSLRV
jgi:UDP-MurNAc hydroxylase